MLPVEVSSASGASCMENLVVPLLRPCGPAYTVSSRPVPASSRPMANHWRVTAILTMLSALRSGRAFLPVAPGRVSRQLSNLSGVRGVVPVDVRSAAAAGCLRARCSEARTGRYGVEGFGVARGLTSSATRLSAVDAVNPASRTSSTTLEQVTWDLRQRYGTTEFSSIGTTPTIQRRLPNRDR